MNQESGYYYKRDNTGINVAIIGIGSNIDAEKNISAMLDILGSGVNIVKISKLVKTKPIGIKDQPDYINGAVKVETVLNIDKLRLLLKNIEDRLGRDREGPKFGPRTIDLDIIAWNGKIVHQEYFSRDFLRDSVDEVSR
jgi:2-amino-4-hydroxy-6-hydroxymethyldihydropteridine diphosphokinase